MSGRRVDSGRIARRRRSRSAPGSHRSPSSSFRFRELGIVLALVLVVGVTAIDNPNFVSATSLQQLLSGASIIALLAIGETIVIVTRNVDLSIGSVLGLSAYAAGHALRRTTRTSRSPLVFLAGAGIGARLRGRQRRDRDALPRAEPRRHARHALRHPRHRRRAGPAATRSARSACPTRFNKIGYGTFLGVPYLGDRDDRRVAIATYAMRAFRTGPRPLRDRLEPRGRAARRHPRRPARLRRLRPQRRDRRLRGRALALASSARSTRSPARATSSR